MELECPGWKILDKLISGERLLGNKEFAILRNCNNLETQTFGEVSRTENQISKILFPFLPIIELNSIVYALVSSSFEDMI